MLNRFLSSKTGAPGDETEEAKLNLTVSALDPNLSPSMADFTAPAAHASSKTFSLPM